MVSIRQWDVSLIPALPNYNASVDAMMQRLGCWSLKNCSLGVTLSQCVGFEDICSASAHAVCVRQMKSRHWHPGLSNEPWCIDGKEGRHGAAVGMWCWVSKFSAKRWQSKWQKVIFAEALFSLIEVWHGSVWSYCTVSGANNVVAKTDAGRPVILGSTRGELIQREQGQLVARLAQLLLGSPC